MNTIPKVHDIERARGVTWAELAALEPRLNELLWKARGAGAACRARQEVPRVFGPIRNALSELIGFLGEHRNHPVLGSPGAYVVAYWRLHEAVSGLLPPPAPPSAVAEEAEALTQGLRQAEGAGSVVFTEVHSDPVDRSESLERVGAAMARANQLRGG
jgi:hypothetical protein